ncbi:hypothetical protein SUGI_0863270 [Cryptomeria japonica]|uniref:phospholipase A2-alpha n=1 Tax=Cryptomeria japonica TaxID=3369 RepID=UPI0024149848|nr:phospholipase A2-alpha [Cryptomeria japonica]GLJ41712.1 hypothetical protein SUGI_0863270 [Cryptomeria japonica]
MTENQRFDSLIILSITTIVAVSLSFNGRIPGAQALNIGPVNITTSLAGGCSSQCESSFCTVAPLLRYGKYCGLAYSGCPGESPCDALDACCKTHDSCVQVQNGDYLSLSCNQALLNCIDSVRASGAPSFAGSNCDMEQVTSLVYDVIELAIVAGRALHQP